MFLFLVWDVSKTAFVLPYFNIPIYWYSLFFAIGLYGSLLIAKHLLTTRTEALGLTSSENTTVLNKYADHLFIYLFAGLLIGARLGHVLFYDATYYTDHLWEIFNLRQGGLSSHGAIIGLLSALFLFEKRTPKTALFPREKDTLDLLAISSGWAAFCIRCGNLMNQEIIGTPSSVPWAIIFTEPVDGLEGIPRHPAQIYEALVSLVLLGVFLFIGRKGRWATNGSLAGFYLFLTFGARYFIEMVKAPQCEVDQGGIHMGQLLSIPILLLSLYLIISARGKKSGEQNELRRKR